MDFFLFVARDSVKKVIVQKQTFNFTVTPIRWVKYVWKRQNSLYAVLHIYTCLVTSKTIYMQYTCYNFQSRQWERNHHHGPPLSFSMYVYIWSICQCCLYLVLVVRLIFSFVSITNNSIRNKRVQHMHTHKNVRHELEQSC